MGAVAGCCACVLTVRSSSCSCLLNPIMKGPCFPSADFDLTAEKFNLSCRDYRHAQICSLFFYCACACVRAC